MRDARLLVHLAERFEAVPGVQRCHILLGVQEHPDGSEIRDRAFQKSRREPLTPVVGASHHPADDAVCVEVLRLGIPQHPQARDRVPRAIEDEVVHGCRLEVAPIELLLIDVLLEEEHIRAKLEHGVELLQRELVAASDKHGTIGHPPEFNGVLIDFLSTENPMTYNVDKSDAEWREQLTPEEYAVLRQAATERPWTGELLDENRTGVYKCKGCGQELFRSNAKFDSHCGWPSFYIPSEQDAVELVKDTSLGMERIEVRCANCGSHLGHVFDDAPQTPTGDRYCMNSVSLTFEATE